MNLGTDQSDADSPVAKQRETGPRVSVVIPLGNAERTIARTLRCVMAQTVSDIEIIVIDDGSRDRGPDIVRSLIHQDGRISLHSQPNAGVAAARNRGIELARSPFVATLDADDLWSPRKLEWQLAVFAESGPDLGLVYCFFDAIDADDRLLWRGPRRQVDGPALQALLREDFIGNGSNALVRRDLLERIGGYDPLLRGAGAQGGEDWQIGLKLAEICEFACVPDVLVGYRRTRGNMSGDVSQMLRSARLVAEPFALAYPEYRPAIDAHIADRRHWLLARAMADANPRGVAGIVRDIGKPKDVVAIAASVSGPVLRDYLSLAVRKLGLRKRPAFL